MPSDRSSHLPIASIQIARGFNGPEPWWRHCLNGRRSHWVGLMVGQRDRRWTSIRPTLGHYIMLPGHHIQPVSNESLGQSCFNQWITRAELLQPMNYWSRAASTNELLGQSCFNQWITGADLLQPMNYWGRAASTNELLEQSCFNQWITGAELLQPMNYWGRAALTNELLRQSCLNQWITGAELP